MPITIKNPKLGEHVKRMCKWSIVCSIISACFTAVLFLCMNRIVETGSKVLTTAVFAVFMIYLASCCVCAAMGVSAYKHEDSLGSLGKSLVYIANIVICLMNLRFGLSLLLAAYGADDAVSRIIGSQGQEAFTRAQYVPWLALLSGMMVNLMVSVFSTMKLVKDK